MYCLNRVLAAQFRIVVFTEETGMVERELELQLQGYGLTTAHILYRLPDFPTLLQSYVWQDYDLAPEFPEMHGFLEFWEKSLDGPLHSVRFAHKRLIAPGEWRHVDGRIMLN